MSYFDPLMSVIESGIMSVVNLLNTRRSPCFENVTSG